MIMHFVHRISHMFNPHKRFMRIILLVLIATAIFACGPEKRVKKRFVPKPCLACHEERLPDFQKRYVHQPVKEKACESCHVRHGKLAVKSFIERVESRLCFTCHSEMATLMQGTPNVHTPLKQGQCVPCHDPHASEETSLQKKTGSHQCFTCHKQEPFKNQNRHKALDKGCLVCHSAHGSAFPANLVKKEINVCDSCHAYDSSEFRSAHKNYPVEQSR